MSEYNDTNPRSPRDKPCYFCENTEFTWGQAITGGTLDKDKKYIFFRPSGTAFEDGDIPLYARRCDVCSNIILFAVDS